MNPETGSQSPTPSCPQCSGPIPPDAPGGLCPRCLLLGAARPSEPAGLGGAASEPSLDEVRAAFPSLEVIERLGAGGMGVVFKARQLALDRWVALKVLPRHLATDPAFTERFQREARLLARLSHPGIVAVHDFGQSGPFCYLLLEYVDGVTLRQAMRTGEVTPAEALALVPRICEALQFAHDHGVLHRDIKPENILLDTAGRVKITDFGIAKLVGDPLGDIALTENGARLGTPHYMAPEQVEDPARVDHRADIYSLGVVFYELLTGELPLGRFAAPSMKSDLDARIDDIVLRALAKERELRQQSAGEVKTQVEHVARNPAVPAPPSSPPSSPLAPSEGPAISMTRLNWAVGWVTVSLLLAGPAVMAAGFYVRHSRPVEWRLIALALVPGLVCGVAGTILAELEMPAFRRNPALKVGRFRLMFALGTWPTVLAQFCAGVLAICAGLILSGFRGRPSLELAAEVAVATVVVVGMLMPWILVRHVGGPAEPQGKGRMQKLQWLLHGGITVLFLVAFSNHLALMVLRDREQVARQAVSQSFPPPPGGLTAEQQELHEIRDQLHSLRQWATTDANPTNRGRLIDLEGREAYLRAVVEGNSENVARAALDHVRAVLAFTEEEHRAGRATTDSVNRARTLLDLLIKNTGPAAGNAP